MNVRTVDYFCYGISLSSAIGAMLLMIEFGRRPALRSRVLLRPLLYETVSQFFRALTLLVEIAPLILGHSPIGDYNPTACATIGVVDQFASVSCFLWYAVIATNAAIALSATVERPSFTQPEKRQRIVRREERIVLAIASISIIPPLMQGAFGQISTDAEVTFDSYDCWIHNGTTPPLGQVINYATFVIACFSGIALIIMVFKNRHRLTNFSDTWTQSMRFTLIFLTLWILQHVSDFQVLLRKSHKTNSSSKWTQANVALKGIGGLVTFLTWYFSPALSTKFDEIEEVTSVDDMVYSSMDDGMDYPGGFSDVDGMGDSDKLDRSSRSRRARQALAVLEGRESLIAEDIDKDLK